MIPRLRAKQTQDHQMILRDRATTSRLYRTFPHLRGMSPREHQMILQVQGTIARLRAR